MTISDDEIARLRALSEAMSLIPFSTDRKTSTIRFSDNQHMKTAFDFLAETYVPLPVLLDALEAERKRADEAQKSFETYAIMYDNSQRGIKEMMDQRDTALAEIERLKAALTPSEETKAAYMSEFQFPSTIERTYNETVPWATIKEIMAAICARAALKGQTDGE